MWTLSESLPKPVAHMPVLLTNDDGIDAPGLQALQTVVAEPVIVVAPRSAQSSCGHQITTAAAITVERRAENAHAVDGTPADCVRIALRHLAHGAELVLSGINAGLNLGGDTFISGTVAAAREAAFSGVPAIALSQLIVPGSPIDWERSARLTKRVLEDLVPRPLNPGEFWNVNLPHVEQGGPEPEIVFCRSSAKPIEIRYRVEDNRYSIAGIERPRERKPGSDVEACFNGNIAVALLTTSSDATRAF